MDVAPTCRGATGAAAGHPLRRLIPRAPAASVVAASLAILLLSAPAGLWAQGGGGAGPGQPPVASFAGGSPPTTITIAALQKLRFTFTGIDPDGDPISMVPATLPAGAVLTTSPGPSGEVLAEVTWRPTQLQTGSFAIQVDVTAGGDVVPVGVGVTVLPASSMVTLETLTPSGTMSGQPFTMRITAPTASVPPIIAVIGAPAATPLPLPESLFGGTCFLGVDFFSMIFLFNGLEAPQPNFLVAPFEFSTVIPPGLDGTTLAFQGFVIDAGIFHASAPSTVVFGQPPP